MQPLLSPTTTIFPKTAIALALLPEVMGFPQFSGSVDPVRDMTTALLVEYQIDHPNVDFLNLRFILSAIVDEWGWLRKTPHLPLDKFLKSLSDAAHAGCRSRIDAAEHFINILLKRLINLNEVQLKNAMDLCKAREENLPIRDYDDQEDWAKDILRSCHELLQEMLNFGENKDTHNYKMRERYANLLESVGIIRRR